ncbi:MAG: YjjG family noncanonical pyrimidine nucleotidase [Clostridia bacterium]|nr:YjjG family noncanonical pyrimidine nucleotidase [Clostridia bacterium]
MKYDVILFDADDTLLDFQKSEESALERVFSTFGIELTGEIRRGYSQINLSLWKALERGEVTKQQVLDQRFQRTFQRYGIDAPKDGSFEQTYQQYLAEGAFVLPEAERVLRALEGRCRLAIVTNGVARTQLNRLRLSGLDQIVRDVFISERIGAEKPQKKFFDVVFHALGEPPRERVLIVGDSLTSDMRGGVVAGIDNCWFNPSGAENGVGVPVTYEIRSLTALLEIVGA